MPSRALTPGRPLALCWGGFRYRNYRFAYSGVGVTITPFRRCFSGVTCLLSSQPHWSLFACSLVRFFCEESFVFCCDCRCMMYSPILTRQQTRNSQTTVKQIGYLQEMHPLRLYVTVINSGSPEWSTPHRRLPAKPAVRARDTPRLRKSWYAKMIHFLIMIGCASH